MGLYLVGVRWVKRGETRGETHVFEEVDFVGVGGMGVWSEV